jgi:cysteine-rich repeat protein
MFVLFVGATLAGIGCSPSGVQGRATDATVGDAVSGIKPGDAGAADTWLVITIPHPKPCVCGDGVLCQSQAFPQYEGCDDGNTKSNDGCDSKCQVEPGWTCATPGRPCQPTAAVYQCGNGILSLNEACDDGNTASGDGCSGDCLTIENGWRCRVPGRPCVPVCGDGLLIGGEGCDDGNTVSGDGCGSMCQVEPGDTCGDGIVTPDEECDDGNDPSKSPHNDDSAYGGCTTACTYGSYCGDGIINGTEECDDGSANNWGYGKPGSCSLYCTKSHYCGDGIVDFEYGEQCDVGDLTGQSGQTCDPRCNYII